MLVIALDPNAVNETGERERETNKDCRLRDKKSSVLSLLHSSLCPPGAREGRRECNAYRKEIQKSEILLPTSLSDQWMMGQKRDLQENRPPSTERMNRRRGWPGRWIEIVDPFCVAEMSQAFEAERERDSRGSISSRFCGGSHATFQALHQCIHRQGSVASQFLLPIFIFDHQRHLWRISSHPPPSS